MTYPNDVEKIKCIVCSGTKVSDGKPCSFCNGEGWCWIEPIYAIPDEWRLLTSYTNNNKR